MEYRAGMGSSPSLADQDANYGFVMSRRLGDSLVSMVVVENLRRAGRAVTVYGDHIHALRHRFPDLAVEPLPTNGVFDPRWRAHDHLLHFRPADVLPGTRESHPGTVVLDEIPLHRSLLTDMVSVHEVVSREIFGLPDSGRETGVVRPEEVDRAVGTRIMIHPTAGDPSRAWRADRYLQVAGVLRERGWDPEFTTHPDERASTGWIEAAGFPRFASGDLDELATRLLASRGFLGSDSGVAHLASCLGLPFVTLYIRRKVAIRWKPGWSDGEAVRPSWPLVFKPIKERWWSRALTTASVTAAAERVFGRPD